MYDAIKASAERFAHETKGHEATVLHDHGPYWHVRSALPVASDAPSFYWFELLAAPNSLMFRSADRVFVFCGTVDMLGFFRRANGEIHPQLWANRLRSGQEYARSYSMERFEEYTDRTVGFAEDDYPGAVEAWKLHVESGFNTEYEEGAREAIAEFRYVHDGAPGGTEPFRFLVANERSFDDWDWWFLFACHAIVWGIAEYDKAQKPVATVSV